MKTDHPLNAEQESNYFSSLDLFWGTCHCKDSHIFTCFTSQNCSRAKWQRHSTEPGPDTVGLKDTGLDPVWRKRWCPASAASNGDKDGGITSLFWSCRWLSMHLPEAGVCKGSTNHWVLQKVEPVELSDPRRHPPRTQQQVQGCCVPLLGFKQLRTLTVQMRSNESGEKGEATALAVETERPETKLVDTLPPILWHHCPVKFAQWIEWVKWTEVERFIVQTNHQWTEAESRNHSSIMFNIVQ